MHPNSRGHDKNLSIIYATLNNYNRPISVTQSIPQYSSDILKNANENQLGFEWNSLTVLDQVEDYVTLFKTRNPASIPIAAIQADLVTHSMGGDIARYLPLRPFFKSYRNFSKGAIHKTITIGTPHLGTPLATQLLQDENSCVRDELAYWKSLISFVGVFIPGDNDSPGFAISGGVFDLKGDGVPGGDLSLAIQKLQNNSTKMPTAMLAGVMSDAQLNALRGSATAEWLNFRCGLLNLNPLALNLAPEFWPRVVSPFSDAIVPLTSQVNGLSSFLRTETAVHSAGTVSLGFGGPHEYQGVSNFPTRVIELLNTPVANSSFALLP